MKNAWRSGRRGSIIITTAPRATSPNGCSAPISRAARKTGLPLVIHTRDADADMAAILAEEMARGKFKALLHCFSSSRALAEKGVELGLYVSFSGIITFKNSSELRDIARDLPLDRLLVETDAPFLAPTPYRGKTNEPAYVAQTAQGACRGQGRRAGGTG